jgi:hypothetical protein
MEDRRILNRAGFFAGACVLVFVLLGSCCTTFVRPEYFIFSDASGHPLPGVLVSYLYSGTGAFNGYSKPGGSVVSDHDGRARVPAAFFLVRPFDSKASPYVSFVYSEKTHSGGFLNDGSPTEGTRRYETASPVPRTTRIILEDCSGSPEKWFFCLIELAEKAREIPDARKLWESEKRDFIEKYGQEHFSSEFIREVESRHETYSHAYRKEKDGTMPPTTYGQMINIYEAYAN